MQNRIGITQWNGPWAQKDLCMQAERAGLESLHLELGSSEDGYPMSRPEIQCGWLENTERYHLQIVSLALNDLCGHGFTAGLKAPQSETAVATMKYGVETARAMGIPSISVPHFFANRITDRDSFDASVEALRFLCDMAADNGILIHTENVLSNPELERLWNEVDRENLRLLFDSQNYAAMAGLDAAEIFQKWQGYCGSYLHIKDGITPTLGDQPLWKGNSNFERIFNVIRNSGFTGDLILESNYADEATLLQDMKQVSQCMSGK